MARTLHDVASREFIEALVDDVPDVDVRGCCVRVFEGRLGIGGGNAIAEPGVKLLMKGHERSDGWGGRLRIGRGAGRDLSTGDDGSVRDKVADHRES